MTALGRTADRHEINVVRQRGRGVLDRVDFAHARGSQALGECLCHATGVAVAGRVDDQAPHAGISSLVRLAAISSANERMASQSR